MAIPIYAVLPYCVMTNGVRFDENQTEKIMFRCAMCILSASCDRKAQDRLCYYVFAISLSDQN